ncbi:MAG: signal peptidase I [Oscillospiraceae bacterium]|nr:signal peptidase I [Oscillospiraceae bacterium]
MEQNERETTASAEELVTEEAAEVTAAAETSRTETASEPSGTADKADAGEAAAKVDWFSEIVEILETMLISVFVILLIFSYLMRPVTVDGNSMVPTLHDTDRLVMYRLLYRPSVGDIVVVNDHGGHIFAGDEVVESGYSLDECIIKRVIAKAGQKVMIDATAGEVYVDDVLLDEPYINELTYTDDMAFQYPITIPEGYVFVMGDNRNHSSDSRSVAVGLVDVNDVLGKAYFRYHSARDEITGEKLDEIGFVK